MLDADEVAQLVSESTLNVALVYFCCAKKKEGEEDSRCLVGWVDESTLPSSTATVTLTGLDSHAHLRLAYQLHKRSKCFTIIFQETKKNSILTNETTDNR